MIIRSGLIRNRDGVELGEFTKHWHEVHGPLVSKINGLRAYSQNHVVSRFDFGNQSTLHRVDGISQLYFDNIPAMKMAMSSPEQEACIVDLRSFLSDVTVLIQDMGNIESVGMPISDDRKLLILLHGETLALKAMVASLKVHLQAQRRSARVRLSPIIARDVIVDESIPTGEQLVDAVFELWFDHDATKSVANSLLIGAKGISIIDGFVVRELPIL